MAPKDKIVAGSKQSRAESSDSTPLMVQYYSIKDNYKDEVLFFRLGDFYEMFDSDALEISKVLNLTLTHRGTVPMCGVPYHSAKNYIARLLRLGKKIAICEQVGDIPQAGKGIAERKVIEVITPGTALESEYLEGGANNFLAAFSLKKGRAGFAYIDVTTSDFFATSWNESETEENFSKEIGRTLPRELILPETLRRDKRILSVLEEYPSLAVSYYPEWNFDNSLSYKRLVSQFKTVNLNAFSLTEDSAEVGPAGFLLDYIQKNSTSTAPHVSGIKVYRDFDFVVIDDSSRRNLEITGNLRDGSVSYTLLECISYTQTAMGNRLLRHWLNYPLTDEKEIQIRQDRTEFFVKNRPVLENIRHRLSFILDIERLAGRIAMERAHAKDIVALKTSLQNWLLARTFAGNSGIAFTPVESAEKIIELIENSILDDPATSLTDGRIIKDGWSEELDELRNLKDNASQILDEYIEEERNSTGIQNLRIRKSNNAGYYIEVTKGKLTQIPEHFIFRRSLINAERYTTPRLQELEHELNEAESRIFETERDLFIEVRSRIAEEIPYLMQTAHEIAVADVSCSLSYAALIHGWVRPVITGNSTEFIVKNGRHPVVESHLPHGEFVPNDTKITGGAKKSENSARTNEEVNIQDGESHTESENSESLPSFALITGPNMAGKSTYLRQNALIAILSQIGSFVPADYAKIGITDRIFCRVGASDNLARGESTFLVEMTETANILRSATDRSLVIMDEVGRGTSTEDGLSIAWAVSEYLLEAVKCRTLFATHYHELTRMEHPALKRLCMAVSESAGSVVFLRKIKEGSAENSYGIHVARLAGVPQKVIDRAEEILRHIQRLADERPVIAEPKNDSDTNSVSDTSDFTAKNSSQSVPGLFSNEELVFDEIISTDPENITPLNALQLVARWKNFLLGE